MTDFGVGTACAHNWRSTRVPVGLAHSPAGTDENVTQPVILERQNGFAVMFPGTSNHSASDEFFPVIREE